MKLIPKLRSKINLLSLCFLALLAPLIWFLGPRLFIAQHFPLENPHKRLALILTFFLAWLLKFIFLDCLNPIAPDNSSLTQMLHALRGRFLGALSFLKKTIIDKHGFSTPLNKLPWYLLIGPPGAGKTTLLAYSNINFILSKQYKQEGQEKTLAASTVCDWWVTRDLVLVDVPGCYTFSPPKDPATEELTPEEKNKENSASTKSHLQLSLWKSLLNLLTKYRQKNNIGAIIVALHLPELIKQSRQQQTQWFQDMKERLLDCWSKFGNLPVYFLITKCDLLPGFCEFFNDIGSDELIQPWGIPLSARKEHENLLDIFNQRFNALIKRLNKQLIWRLNQERNPQARPLIKDFPLQLEFLKETLSHLIRQLLASNPSLDLEGIYLTSTTQTNSSSSATTLFHHDLPSALQTPPSPFVSRPYFVKHIISYLLPHTSHHLIQRFRQKRTWLPQFAYGLGFSMLLLAVLWIGKDFQRSLYQVSSMQRYLTQYQLYLQSQQSNSITNLNSALPLLNTLEAAAQPLNYASRLQQIETFYSKKSQQTAETIYHNALQTIILPPLRNEFEKYLQAADDKNPEQLYLALKAYLLLRQQDHKISSAAQADFIIHALQTISPTFNPKTLNKELLQHIQNTLQNKQANVLDTKLIRQTRKQLNSLSDNELAYILLKNMANNNKEDEINLGTNIGTPPALISKGTATLIPHLFTAQAFPVVIKEEIPLAAQEVISGNEVLGKKFVQSDSLLPLPSMISSLSAQLEKAYISHYIDIWESLVDNISLNSPKNRTEIDAMIMNLISSHSPLLQLLQTIHENTEFDPILSSSFKLQALNTLYHQTQSKQKDSLYQIFTDLHQLHVLLQKEPPLIPSKIKPSPAVQIRMMTDKYPEPIKSWLQILVSYTQNHLQGGTSSIDSSAKVEVKEEPAEEKTAAAQNLEEASSIASPVLLNDQPRKQSILASPQKEPLIAQIKRAMIDKKGDYALHRSSAATTKKAAAAPQASKGKQAAKAKGQRQEGEYLRVVEDQQHPLIFVQKD